VAYFLEHDARHFGTLIQVGEFTPMEDCSLLQVEPTIAYILKKLHDDTFVLLRVRKYLLVIGNFTKAAVRAGKSNL
jgi:hypothetical protein